MELKASTCLRISSACFFLLGIFVFITLWLTPDVLPYSQNQEAVDAARVWGDVNGMAFLSLALIWFFSSNFEDLKPKKVIGMSNFIICILLLCLSTLHMVLDTLDIFYLNPPPPPVWIFLTISGGMGFYAWRKSTA